MLPDLCLVLNSNEAQAGVGQPESVGGGVPTTGSITANGMSFAATIGNMPCNRPVLTAIANGNRTFNITLARTDGTPVDLSNTDHVEFVVKETYDANAYYIQKNCTVTTGTAGLITIALDKTELPYAGVWLASLRLIGATGAIQAQYDMYLYVERDYHSGETKNKPISITDVRMELLDRCPSDNALLDDVEFGDSAIAYCILKPVNEWNETPPIIGQYQYTQATFPYRYHWVQATCAELLRMAARNLIRNKLDYNAGGLNVQDRARGAVYLQIAEQMRAEWQDWMRREKVRLNAESCYGSVSSRSYF